MILKTETPLVLKTATPPVLAGEYFLCFDISMDPDIDGAAHKLQAALVHGWHDLDGTFPASYVEACHRWFAVLSEDDRRIADAAVAAFERYDETEAEKIAENLGLERSAVAGCQLGSPQDTARGSEFPRQFVNLHGVSKPLLVSVSAPGSHSY